MYACIYIYIDIDIDMWYVNINTYHQLQPSRLARPSTSFPEAPCGWATPERWWKGWWRREEMENPIWGVPWGYPKWMEGLEIMENPIPMDEMGPIYEETPPILVAVRSGFPQNARNQQPRSKGWTKMPEIRCLFLCVRPRHCQFQGRKLQMGWCTMNSVLYIYIHTYI